MASAMTGMFVTTGLGAVNLGTGNIKAEGFNKLQIGDMGTMNSFIGSMAGATVTLGTTGNVTFNVLRAYNTGLFEITVGQDGFQSRLGTGGVDVSLGTLQAVGRGLENWGKNNAINAAARESGLVDAATGLRVQWGYGDAAAKEQLEAILDGSAVLRQGSGAGDAETVLENGQRVVYLNGYQEGMSVEERLGLGITLQHEAYRDGYKPGDIDGNGDQVTIESNTLETRAAVLGHTEMAIRMLMDGQGLGLTDNLKSDIGEYLFGDRDSFNAYVDDNYDSSADYWKLVVHEDGSHEFQWDGHLNIYDEGGNELVHYTELQNLIQNSGKILELNGIAIQLKELMVLQRYNYEMVSYALKNPSIASTAILNDGFMSMDEAVGSYYQIMNRYNNNYLQGVNMVEHWSVRYILNDMDTLVAAINGKTYEWINQFDKNNADKWFGPQARENAIPYTSPLADNVNDTNSEIILRLVITELSVLHGLHNFKWQSNEYGNELVFRNGKLETDPRYIGTFNFGRNGIDHFNLDMDPYYQWGNSPNDTSNYGNWYTSIFGRRW
jgi:hypothetical protein